MKTALYTKIDAVGVPEIDVIRRAHTLGIELVPFDGWTDADLTSHGGRRGSRPDIAANSATIAEIIDTFPVTETECVSIFSAVL